ncbi:MAG: anaerobic sulfatase-maturation protein [Verrucomicrobiaceae bacterium]|nr:MAG: anaerobic sulfatase-maturation protein [Verrucomicrobiaceae bacterium]
MAKPIGPVCNLDCTYCYYLEKEKLFPKGENFRMKPEVLESYIRQYAESQGTSEITFTWQGGEPTLLGVDYFRKIVTLEKKYAGGRPVHNALQTNGTRLDHEWCHFFRENHFLVGLSIDGPRALHDTYRVDKGRKPTYDRMMHGLDLLKKHGVEFNTLTVVNASNVKHPLLVYDFLRETGSGYIQFLPLVERLSMKGDGKHRLDFAEPSEPGQLPSSVIRWSVNAELYGDFLVQIFDQWVRRDVGKVFVQLFDVSLGIWAGKGAGLCLFLEDCGQAMALEHNGDLFSCDHFVYPKYHLGNIMNDSLKDMADSLRQRSFGRTKSRTLPQYCLECEVRFACNGECPTRRFIKTPDGEDGLNYLCSAYKKFFHHVDPFMKQMTALLHANRAPAEIMTRF